MCYLLKAKTIVEKLHNLGKLKEAATVIKFDLVK